MKRGAPPGGVNPVPIIVQSQGPAPASAASGDSAKPAGLSGIVTSPAPQQPPHGSTLEGGHVDGGSEYQQQRDQDTRKAPPSATAHPAAAAATDAKSFYQQAAAVGLPRVTVTRGGGSGGGSGGVAAFPAGAKSGDLPLPRPRASAPVPTAASSLGPGASAVRSGFGQHPGERR